MVIENIRKVSRVLLFKATIEKGDPNVTVVCGGCILDGNGCSHENNPIAATISGRINLDSDGVKQVSETNVPNCGIGTEVVCRR